MKTPILLLSILAALGLHAAGPEGLVSKSATGTTVARVAFEPGDRGFSLSVADATSDKAASVFSWRYGTTPLTIARAAASSVTSLVFYASAGQATQANATVFLTAPTNGLVTNLTVLNSSLATNSILYLQQPLGTAMAVGDVVRERLAPATLTADLFTNTTNAWLDSLTGLAANDVVLIEAGANLRTNTIHAVANQTNRAITISDPLPVALAIGDPVHEVLTNRAVLLGNVSASGTNVHVATTNSFSAGVSVLIRAANGKEAIRPIHAVSATNIALLGAPGFALTTNDVLYRLTNSTTVAFPVPPGITRLELVTHAGLTNGDTLVITNASLPPFTVRHHGGDAASIRYRASLKHTNTFTAPAGFTIAKLTNTHTLTLAAPAGAFEVVASSSTALAQGDSLILNYADGSLARSVLGAVGSQPLLTVNFTGNIGSAMNSGDNAYVSSSAVTSPVGNTTVRLIGSGLFSAPPGRPGQLTVDGTSAVTINQAVADYGR